MASDYYGHYFKSVWGTHNYYYSYEIWELHEAKSAD